MKDVGGRMKDEFLLSAFRLLPSFFTCKPLSGIGLTSSKAEALLVELQRMRFKPLSGIGLTSSIQAGVAKWNDESFQTPCGNLLHLGRNSLESLRLKILIKGKCCFDPQSLHCTKANPVHKTDLSIGICYQLTDCRGVRGSVDPFDRQDRHNVLVQSLDRLHTKSALNQSECLNENVIRGDKVICRCEEARPNFVRSGVVRVIRVENGEQCRRIDEDAHPK